jgi:serine/threonine-protein kinase PknK
MTSGARRATPVDAPTRFRAPAYVRNLIERRRLLGLLRAGSGRQLVVIHAPAG